jgi:hypothetical protein
MSGSYYTLNNKYNQLLALLNSITGGGGGGVPTSSNLAVVLDNGNSAGTFDIDMNNNDILQVDNIDLVTINGSAYPPPSSIATNLAGGIASQIPFQSALNTTSFIANGTSGQYLKSNGTATPSWATIPVIPATPTLSQVLVAGNSAGLTSINMNNNNITSVGGLYGQIVQLTNTTATTTLNVASGSATTTTLLTKFNNQRTAQTGEAIRLDFNAKNSAGTEFNYGKIHMNTPTVTAGSERGRIDIDVNDALGLTTYLSCNGNAGSVQMTASFLDMTSKPILAVSTITDFQALPFLPQADIDANSNVPTTITNYANRHQVLLRAEPVTVIDRFVQQSQFVSGSIQCSCEGSPPSIGSTQWLGTPTGEVYVYDAGSNNWLIIASFTGNSGTVNALFYNSLNDRLYIGGSFTDCASPFQPSLNNVCYIQSPTNSPVTPTQLIWAGQGDAGFNDQCNAIAGEGTADYVYFGGNFIFTFNNTIQLNYFGCYQESTNSIVAINNIPSDGFDNRVYNLNYMASGGYMCATGFFTLLTSNGFSIPSPYCILFIISNDVVSAIYQLDAGTTSLSSGISGFDLIDNNNSNFFVGIGNNQYNNGVGILNYLMELSLTGSSSQSGGNGYSGEIGSFFYNSSSGYVEAVTSSAPYEYFQNGSLYATIPFQSFIFRFISTGIVYFNNQGNGTQWAFTGSNINTFVLIVGRAIIYGGVTYTGGVVTGNAPVLGDNLLLNWNTAYYIVVSGIPNIGSAWTFF